MSRATGAAIVDLPLAAMRLAMAPAIADEAAFDGWGEAAVDSAALFCDVPVEVARYAFSGGAMQMIAAFVHHIDEEMALALPAGTLATLPVRERILRLIAFRLDAQKGREESLRRALAIMAMPRNLPAALKLGWASADVMWRLSGDISADYNHYTKRATLAAIYAATLAIFVDDRSEDKATTMAFLQRRIDGVMRFEKAKARFVGVERDHFSPARFLGRLRYPAR